MLLLRTSRGVDPGIPLLRSLGSSAHVWLPGANGTTVASLPSNNYLLSDGSTGYSTVDGVDGLTLDGMGSLGSERVTASYGTYNSTLTNGGVFPFTATSTVASNYGASIAALTVGVWYQVTLSWTGNASGRRVFCDAAGNTNLGSSASGTNTVYFQATSITHYIVAASAAGAGETITFTACTVKPYTGTHLTQATTANKPLVRRGMLNELLNSATPATQSVTCIAAPYTLALYGTGNVVLSGTGAGTLTGTGASDLVVLNFTPTAGSVTFTKAGTVSSFGLFKGTFTAAQILAEGGIPTTTATAASNPSAGKYWWSFDGSNDCLTAGSVPFQLADDHCVIAAVNVSKLGPTAKTLYAQSSTTTARCPIVYVNTDGKPHAAWIDDAGTTINLVHPVNILGVPTVITALKRSGVYILRVNGSEISTSSSSLGTTTLTAAGVGYLPIASPVAYMEGALGWVLPLKGTFTDANCLTLERLVGSQFPGMATF